MISASKCKCLCTSPLQQLTLNSGFSAEPLAQQVSDLTPIPVPYSPPVDWVRWAAISGGVLVLGVALYLITTVWIWAVGAIGTSLVMTSGFMFTRIRESPWVGHDGGWIARGWQDQFGTEVLMVVAICLCFQVPPLQLTFILHARRNIGVFVHHAYYGRSEPKLPEKAACSCLCLEYCYLVCLFFFDRVL